MPYGRRRLGGAALDSGKDPDLSRRLGGAAPSCDGNATKHVVGLVAGVSDIGRFQ